MFNLTGDSYWMIICVINVFLFLEQIICNINYVESNYNLTINPIWYSNQINNTHIYHKYVDYICYTTVCEHVLMYIKVYDLCKLQM